jgi:hypothetical protein
MTDSTVKEGDKVKFPQSVVSSQSTVYATLEFGGRSMPASPENVVVLHTVTGENKFKEIAVPQIDIDFEVFGAKEIRDVLKSRAHCLRAGFPPNHIIIITLNEIRDHYLRKVGLPTYLSQMLGDLGKIPTQYCTLYDQEGRPIKLQLNDNPNQPVQRFIAKQFRWNNLPFGVEAQKGINPDRVEIRYL